MARKRKSQQKSDVYASQIQLAKAMGVARSALQKWLKDRRWPFARRAPWPRADLGAMKAWRAETMQPNTADVPEPDEDDLTEPPAKDARKRWMLARAKRAEHDLKVARSEVHSKVDCDAAQIQRIHQTKAGLLALPVWLSSELVGLTAKEIQARLTKEFETLLRGFAAGRFVGEADK